LFSGALNIARFKITGRATTILTLFLGGTLLLFAIAVFTSGSWDASLLLPFFTQGSGGSTGFLDALPLAMVAYGAIVALSFLVGEVETEQDRPKAMAIAMPWCLLFSAVLVATLGLFQSFLELKKARTFPSMPPLPSCQTYPF
jgi:APA family basic amino acid/polyamine antiporter